MELHARLFIASLCLTLVAASIMVFAGWVEGWSQGDDFKAGFSDFCQRNASGYLECGAYEDPMGSNGFRLAAMVLAIITIVTGLCPFDPSVILFSLVTSFVTWGCWLGFHFQYFSDEGGRLGPSFFAACATSAILFIAVLFCIVSWVKAHHYPTVRKLLFAAQKEPPPNDAPGLSADENEDPSPESGDRIPASSSLRVVVGSELLPRTASTYTRR